MSYELRLTDEQWSVVKPILTKQKRETRGRKRRGDKELFEAALYKFVNRGASWRDLPAKGYPPHQSCYRQFFEWDQRKVLIPAIEALAIDLEERGGVPISSCFMNELFAAHPPGVEIFIMNDDPIWLCDPPPKPWCEATKEYFESPMAWVMFYNSQDEWIRSRIPHDLLDRIKSVF